MEEDGGEGRGRASAGQGRERGSCTGKSAASLEPLSSLKRGIGGTKIRGLWPWPMALVPVTRARPQEGTAVEATGTAVSRQTDRSG